MPPPSPDKHDWSVSLADRQYPKVSLLDGGLELSVRVTSNGARDALDSPEHAHAAFVVAALLNSLSRTTRLTGEILACSNR